jgi:hypothetical protein
MTLDTRRVDVFIMSFVSLILAIAGIMYCIVKTATASGQIEYCYVSTYFERSQYREPIVLYDLVGQRNWRLNRKVAENLHSLDEVKKAAELYGCQLK